VSIPRVNILYSGYGNIGDEMILVGTLKVLKMLGLKHVNLYDVYEGPPFKLSLIIRKELNDLYVEYIGVNELLGSRANRILNYAQTALGLMPPVNTVFNRGIRKRGRENIDAILWHRGCSSYDSYHGTRHLALSIISTASIASQFLLTVLGGLSMGYTETVIDRELLRAFLKYWRFIMLREPYSFRYVKSLVDNKRSLYLVHDFAIYAERMSTEASENIKRSLHEIREGKPVIGLVLRDYYYQKRFPADMRRKYLFFIKKLVKALQNEGYMIIFVPTGYLYGHENDIAFYTELIRTRIIDNNSVVLDPARLLTPGEFVDVLSTMDMVLSVRTHGFIASALGGTPAVHLYYEHKGAGILKFTFGMSGIDLSRCIKSVDECIKEVRRAIEERDNIRKFINVKIQRAREYNYKLLKEEVMPIISVMM